MRKVEILFASLCVSVLTCGGPARAAPAQGVLKALLVTGGHGYEEKPFHAVFDEIDGLIYDHHSHEAGKPGDPFAAMASAEAESYDAIVLYDMWQPITDPQKETFAGLVRGGKGLVVLHHALASFQAWPEYRRMIGGRYFTAKHVDDGEERPASTYRHDADVEVHVEDPAHFITRGLDDFRIRDEVYGGFAVDPSVNVLLTTEHPESGPVIAWTKPYGKGRVTYIQLGHDGKAYASESYRTLVSRAIRWVARRTPEDLEMRPLFNGKDLSGWRAEGNARFAVEDGILVGRQGPGGAAGDIFTEETYGDFECEATWSMDWPGNSGLWFRYVDDGQAYQTDILEYRDPKCWSGSLYCTGKMFIALNRDPSIVSRDGWNTFRIRARGGRLVVFLNDRKVADVRDDTSRRGAFGLQVHAGEPFADMAIRLADLRVRKLD